MDATEPLYAAFTIDLDPDANRAVPGRPDAVSPGGKAAFTACLEGLEALVSLLEECRLPATFFWEGRTLRALAERDPGLLERVRSCEAFEHGCHGFAHEDFSGTESGVPLGRPQTERALRRANDVFRSHFRRDPEAFRAPYCRMTDHLESVLEQFGYRYDASLTRDLSGEWGLKPYRLEATGLWELALCRTRDARGKPVSGYLWQLLEGNRPAEDYAEAIRSARSAASGGLFQLAIHPWHLNVSAEGRPFGREDSPDRLNRVGGLLEAARGIGGIRFVTAGEYLTGWEKAQRHNITPSEPRV